MPETVQAEELAKSAAAKARASDCVRMAHTMGQEQTCLKRALPVFIKISFLISREKHFADRAGFRKLASQTGPATVHFSGNAVSQPLSETA